MGGYAGLDLDRFVEPSLSSWSRPGWRALLVQRFTHAAAVDELVLPPTTDRHLWLVTAGAGRMHLDTGDGRRVVPIAPGQVGFAVPGAATRVRYETTEPMRTVQLHLPADAIERAAGSLGVPAPAVVRPGPDGGAFLGAMLTSLAAAAEAGLDGLYADTAAEFLAVHLVTGGAGPDGHTARLGREDARVRAAIAYLHDRLDQPVSLADLAAHVRLSPFHFLRVFRRATGETPARYLRRVRIAHATRLLAGGMTVGQVARRCGFSSPGHLSAAYLRETGVRPSAHRPG
ncbi:AraC family transcriptional regulator [Virgisporangium aliadipatigenens]|uniref:AraC family transcriptional regulator n=2 Tax=Virgisporangium aliadipatigenens TaxID=741659 RepID=A0A8J4DTH1_9ACTN|nr:AraC family transcriptional regulator [Virgisporangium aliadipatigenens]